MLPQQHRITTLLSISIIIFSILITSCVPAQIQDRRFLNLSLEFLGEYKLLDANFMNTPLEKLAAITYDRRQDRFYALSEDNSEVAPARFYKLKLTFKAPNSNPAIEKINIESVTFLTDKDGKTYPKGSIEPTGIALTPQHSVFISSAGVIPAVQEFDLNSGYWLNSLPIPQSYLPDTTNGGEHSRGVQKHLGLTSLTLNPTGTIPASGEPIRLFTATASALLQDQELSSPQSKSRFLHYLIGYGSPLVIAEYFYPLDANAGAILPELVELLAIDQGGHFLSLEQASNQTNSNAQIFQMTTSGATDTSRIASLKGIPSSIKPIKKKLLLDLNSLGISSGDFEGMSLGPRLADGTQSLLIVSNSFTKPETQFLLFRIKQN